MRPCLWRRRSMLEHGQAAPSDPQRVVVIGAGFVGGAIASLCGARNIPVAALKRAELDLLAPEAGDRLCALLQPGDSVVLVSAKAPARNPALLLENLRML